MTSLTKIRTPQGKKIFFECRLEDLPCLLTLGPHQYLKQERRYSRAKPRAFRRFFSENPRKQPDTSVNEQKFITDKKNSRQIFTNATKMQSIVAARLIKGGTFEKSQTAYWLMPVSITSFNKIQNELRNISAFLND